MRCHESYKFQQTFFRSFRDNRFLRNVDLSGFRLIHIMAFL